MPAISTSQFTSPPGIHVSHLRAHVSTACLAELICLEKKLFAKADSWADMLPTEVTKKNALLLAAHDTSNSKLVAYILCTCNSTTLHITKLAVSVEYRRRGIARALLEAALLLGMRLRRSLTSTLNVAADNEAALALYTSMGYCQDQVLVDYYRVGKDAIRMVRDLQGQG